MRESKYGVRVLRKIYAQIHSLSMGSELVVQEYLVCAFFFCSAFIRCVLPRLCCWWIEWTENEAEEKKINNSNNTIWNI